MATIFIYIRVSNPFTFKVVSDSYGFTATIFKVFWLFCNSFVHLFLSCCLPL